LAHAPLLSTIAIGLVGAFILGFLAQKVNISPIVGYLFAGVLIGPYTPGFVGDAEVGRELAEIGVVLLMFGVGLHFSMKELLAVRRVALPGAIGQMTVATAAGTGLGIWLGWGLEASLLFGLALSVASTVVMLRALEDRQLLDTRAGHIAVGWLIVEDLAMVIALVVVPVLATGGNTPGEIAASVGWTIVKVGGFVALMVIVGRRVIPWLLAKVADTGSRELFTLAVLALGLGVAVGAAWLFDISFALGAFFAGMILKESPLSHRAADDSLPLRDAFAVLFFVSVGMLVDPAIFVEHPWSVAAVVVVVVVIKFATAFLVVRILKYSKSMSLVTAAALAQIGEFSFILVTLGRDLDILTAEMKDLVLAGAMVSILLNPLLFAWASRAYRQGQRDDAAAADAAEYPTQYEGSDHTIIVGHGRVGARVAAGVRSRGHEVVIIEDNETRVEEIREAGHEAILGNAVRAKVLRAAGVENAHALIVATPDPLTAGAIITKARGASANVTILARGHNDEDATYLLDHGANQVIVGVYEVADIMVDVVAESKPATKRAAKPKAKAKPKS
jgi:CPA2 family monovalent cation:H+ antiporter-2